MDGFLKKVVGSCVALCFTVGLSWGQEKPAADEVQTLRELIQQQQKQINDLNKRLNDVVSTPQPIQPAQTTQPPAGEQLPPPKGAEQLAPPKALNTKDVQSIIADYMRDNPGAGAPNGVQSGYSMGTGFYIKSTPNPAWSNWSDQSGIPWEMRFRGRIQTNYDYYKVQDNYNHINKQFYNNPNSVPPPVSNPQNVLGYQVGDFSAFEVKRMRLIWEGSVFTPNLTYELQLDANTRGFGSFQNNKAFAGTPPPGNGVPGFQAPGLGGASTIGGQIQTDHAARLFTAWLAYQIPLGSRSSNSVSVPDGSYSYTPSLTFIVGKQQPYFSLIEIFGSANSQFAEFNMADWMFDTDANNMMMAVSAQYRGMDDRLMMIGQIANAADFGIPAVQLQRTPEFIGCFWYDFGGEFDNANKRWNLFGNSISDLGYSRKLTVRVGGDMNLVHLDPRNQYGDIPSSFYFVGPGAPGGTRFINLFNGGTAAVNQALQSVNTANIFTYGAFMAAHWRGFSLYNEWYFRYFGDMRSLGPRNNSVFYTDGLGNTALLNRNTFMDYGCAVQAGYFVIPKKFELIGLWSMVNAQSGDIYGTGQFGTFRVPTGSFNSGAASQFTTVRSYQNAFANYHMAQEIGVGFNYYWFGQLIKWTNDLSYYRGGNPAGNGSAPTGFIAGVDGWLIRSQIQIAF